MTQRRGRSGWWGAALALLFGAGQAEAAAHQDALAACTARQWASVLVPVAGGEPAHARAVWLDAGHLRWPGVAASGRFRLHHSGAGAIVAEPGRAVSGSDGALTLAPAEPLPPAVRFRHVAAGVDLALAPEDLARLPELLRDQLVLTQEDADGRVLVATGTQLAGALDDLYAAAATAPGLGAHPGTDATRFRLWAPTARRVALCLYGSDTGAADALGVAYRDDRTGIWEARLPGDFSGRYYTWLVEVFVPGAGLVRNRVTDPYALALGSDSRRAQVVDLDDPALKPGGWDAAPRPRPPQAMTDMVIYELHLRDFSTNDPDVSEAARGKYLAFAEAGSRGMRHLRALAEAGLTDLHLLPVFDFASVPETGCLELAPGGPPDGEAQQALIEAHRAEDCFNWGYDPLHYTVPEGSYASDPADGRVRIREFRRMVQALHGIGLRVGMDVVYNHTSAAGQHEKSVLDRIVPGYYHRLDADGRIETSTCCPNTATEHAMMARLMTDSAVVWVRDYRIDSFRFDLMGHQPRAAMERLQRQVNAAAGRRIPLIGEGWDFGEVAAGARFVQASQRSLAGSGIATFSDRARDALRGGGCCDRGAGLVRNQGWLNGLHYAPNAESRGLHRRVDLLAAADLVRVGLAGTLADYVLETRSGERRRLAGIDYAGQPAGYAAQPGEVVNYVENHDNPTLFDLNAYRLPADTPPAERARVQILGAAVVAFSQGIAYYHAGVEALRSKSFDRNSFDSGDWFNRLDWSWRDNGFGAGLPPASQNREDWPWMRPRLADPRIRPEPAEIAWTRDAFRDLLRIRASSTLFRLPTAADVKRRLTLLDTGPGQTGTVLAGHLDGADYPGAGFREVLYLVNVEPRPRTLSLMSEAGKDYMLHPVHRDPAAADRRPAVEARYRPRDGRFRVPARTAVVFVRE